MSTVYYHFYGANGNYVDNLAFFVSCAINEASEFVIVAASELPFALPDFDNLLVVRVENLNHDYGGYSQALSKAEPTRFPLIFVNSSMRGPFWNGVDIWQRAFIDRLSAETRLVGVSINVLPERLPDSTRYREAYPAQKPPYSHVQSTAYAYDREVYDLLQDCGFYDCLAPLSKADVIRDYEIRLSQLVKAAGWNISSVLPVYSGIDYRKKHRDPNFSSLSGDPMHRGGFFGRTVTPSESIFIKSNRGVTDTLDLLSHTYTQLLRVTDKRILRWPPYLDLLKRVRSDLNNGPDRKIEARVTERVNVALQRNGHGGAAEIDSIVASLSQEIATAKHEAERMRNSLSWKVTTPLRYGYNLLFGPRKK